MRNIVETLNIVKDTFSCLNGVLTLYVWILFADIQDLFFKKYCEKLILRRAEDYIEKQIYPDQLKIADMFSLE
ncbi:MAG: hypothetical protein ACI8W9_001770 [Psychromonas sp.]|jgi:hypothetical protein